MFSLLILFDLVEEVYDTYLPITLFISNLTLEKKMLQSREEENKLIENK